MAHGEKTSRLLMSGTAGLGQLPGKNCSGFWRFLSGHGRPLGKAALRPFRGSSSFALRALGLRGFPAKLFRCPDPGKRIWNECGKHDTRPSDNMAVGTGISELDHLSTLGELWRC